MGLKSQALRFEGLYQVPASRDGYSTICITMAAQHFKAPGTAWPGPLNAMMKFMKNRTAMIIYVTYTQKTSENSKLHEI